MKTANVLLNSYFKCKYGKKDRWKTNTQECIHPLYTNSTQSTTLTNSNRRAIV